MVVSALFVKFLALFTLLSFSGVRGLCPPPESLSPCSCTQYSGWDLISCSNIRGRINFAPIFSRVASTNENPDTPLVYDTLRITGCSGLLEIPENSFADLGFLNIEITNNPNLDWISPKAFSKTNFDLTKGLKLNDNYIWNPSPYTNDIFDFVKSFKALETVNLGMNRLTSIPKQAFESSSVKRIDLDYNRITSIGKNAFASTLNLTLLALTYNSITEDEIHPKAFSGLGNADTVLGIHRNNVTRLRKGTFKPVLDSIKELIAGGGYCNPSTCNYDYLVCDEEANWICKRKETYADKLVGFRCAGDEFEDIWEYCDNGMQTNLLNSSKEGIN